MKESQLRQLIREEISKVMNDEENLGEMIQDPTVLDPMVIGEIIAGLTVLLGGRAAVKSALEQATQGKGALSYVMKPETARKILEFFNGFASGGGSGK
jgi:hypothetical protein